MNPTLLMDVVSHLEQLKDDHDASKKFKEKAEKVIAILQEDSEFGIDKALSFLEEMESLGMSSYCRTQIWDIAGMLESLKNYSGGHKSLNNHSPPLYKKTESGLFSVRK